MQYVYINTYSGEQMPLKAQSDIDAIVEAYDLTRGNYDTMSDGMFDKLVERGDTYCHIDKYADDVDYTSDETEPLSTATIVWDFEYQYPCIHKVVKISFETFEEKTFEFNESVSESAIIEAIKQMSN